MSPSGKSLCANSAGVQYGQVRSSDIYKGSSIVNQSNRQKR